MPAVRQRLAHPSLVLFACLFASQAGLLVLSPILPEIAREFGMSTAAAGQLRTISGATGGATAVLLTVIGRRPGLRALLSGGSLLVAIGSALSAVAPSFAVLAAAQAVVGCGIGLLVAIGIAAAGAWTTPAERSHTLAWAISGMPAAWILGMPVVGAVASVDWRLAWLAVPAAAGLATLGLLRLRAPDAPSRRAPHAGATWRRPEVARFATGELLAGAAWAGVLTYSGTLLIESYGVSAATVAAGLAVTAVAMIPGTFLGRRRAAQATPGFLVALTLAQGAAVVVLAGLRPAAGATFAVLTVMAFVNGWRSIVASALGMDSAPDDMVAVMSLRAAANQLGYLLGAATGGLALALGGYPALGVALGAMFAAGALAHAAPLLTTTPLPAEAPG